MKIQRLWMLALLGVFALATAAQAGSVYFHHNASLYSSSNAGEFLMYNLQGLTVAPHGPGVQVTDGQYVGDFQTFCVQRHEYISLHKEYQFDVSTSAEGPTGSDPISAETAYLFTNFWHGTLSNYDLTLGAGRVASAVALQDALWVLEGEKASTTNVQANTWIAEAQNAVLNNLWSGVGNVRVLNVYRYGQNNRIKYGQDQLVVLPDPPPPPPMVPLPPAAPAGLAMLLGLGVVRRIRRRNAHVI